MRGSFIVAFFTTIFFVSGYFYYTAQAICPVPIAYNIGEIDDRFTLSRDEAKLVAAQAEAVWEDATGQNLFTYDETAEFAIDFIYDERQALTDAEGEYRNELDTTKQTTDQINAQYDELVATYNDLQVSYQNQTQAYEADLATYNATVEQYNEEGGAPASAYDTLEVQRSALEAKRNSLNNTAATLNSMVKEINRIGERGNRLVESYNETVSTYNQTFGSHREFTQGTYNSRGQIEIYNFEDFDELRLVLAHEFGHALSIDHVMGTESIMYFLIGDQSPDLELSDADLEAFIAVCSTSSLWDTIQLGARSLFNY